MIRYIDKSSFNDFINSSIGWEFANVEILIVSFGKTAIPKKIWSESD